MKIWDFICPVQSGLQKLNLAASVLLIFLILTGCATPLKHYEKIDSSLTRGNYSQPISLLKKAREKGNYEKKDRVLYYLELGIANHYAGNYKKSNQLLDNAERSMQELFTKSVSNIGKSLLTNDNELPYRGEPYEEIYVNFFKSLNYARMNDPSASRVEIRKIYEKLKNMERKYKTEAEEYKEAVSSGDLISEDAQKALDDRAENLETADLKFHNSALGRYMGYSMYLSEQDWDDAEIDLRKTKEAFMNQPGIYNFDPPSVLEATSPPRGKAPVHVFALLGRGPVKTQHTLRIPVSKDVGEVKLALPEMKERGTNINKVKLYKNDQLVAELQKLEDINRVAKAVFEMKKSLTVFKTLVRVTVKEFATAKAREQADGSAGLALALAGEIYKEVSEQADLRTSRLLPGEVHVRSFYLPTGKHTLTAKYISKGKTIHSETIPVTVKNDSLNFVELVNLN
ncbi:MAG: COG3014 family protein [bacterium]